MATITLETELSSLYALFDVNGDGSITPTEVEQVLGSMEGIISEQTHGSSPVDGQPRCGER